MQPNVHNSILSIAKMWKQTQCLSTDEWIKKKMSILLYVYIYIYNVCMLRVQSIMSYFLQPYGLQPTKILCPWDSPSKNIGTGCHFLLQGIIATQVLSLHLLHLLHCQEDLLALSHLGFSNEIFRSVQFSSVAQSCPTLCNPMNRSTPVLPVHHKLLELTQTRVHRIGDVIQPSHPLSSPSPPASNPSQHQGYFQ